MKFIGIIITFLISLLGFSKLSHAQTSPDGEVITQLKKAGSNLSKPHIIEFYLYFQTKETAERIERKLVKQGYITKIGLAAKGNEWLIMATKPMIPTESTLLEQRKILDALAKSENGEYDGWGTPIIK